MVTGEGVMMGADPPAVMELLLCLMETGPLLPALMVTNQQPVLMVALPHLEADQEVDLVDLEVDLAEEDSTTFGIRGNKKNI